MSKIDRTAGIDVTEKLPRFEFLAGRVSLDFCNTHSRATGSDRLADEKGLSAWAARCDRGFSRPPTPSEIARFRILRDHLCRAFDAVIHGNGPAQADLDALAGAALPRVNPALRWDATARRVIPHRADDAVDRLYEDIAADAVTLLTDGPLDRLKRCPSDSCQWFFFDSSRNGRRRWCAMADCGTKAKVRQFRARQQGTDAAF